MGSRFLNTLCVILPYRQKRTIQLTMCQSEFRSWCIRSGRSIQRIRGRRIGTSCLPAISTMTGESLVGQDGLVALRNVQSIFILPATKFWNLPTTTISMCGPGPHLVMCSIRGIIRNSGKDEQPQMCLAVRLGLAGT